MFLTSFNLRGVYPGTHLAAHKFPYSNTLTNKACDYYNNYYIINYKLMRSIQFLVFFLAKIKNSLSSYLFCTLEWRE